MKKKKKCFVIHQLKILKIPHHRGILVGIAKDMVQRRDTKGALVQVRGEILGFE